MVVLDPIIDWNNLPKIELLIFDTEGAGDKFVLMEVGCGFMLVLTVFCMFVYIKFRLLMGVAFRLRLFEIVYY